MASKLSANAKKIIKMLLFTALFMFIFRMGYWVTLPFVNYKILVDTNITLADFGFLNAIGGGSLSHFSVLCLGISPYITSSIVVQLLEMDIVPTLKEWSEEGETGKQKLNQLIKYIALGLAFVQALTLTIGISASYSDVYFSGSYIDVAKPVLYIYLALVATAGTAFTMWLASLISKYGVGNGTSMIICAGILASFPGMIKDLVTNYVTADEPKVWLFILTLVLLLMIIVFIVFMEAATRKIPIQYANRPATNSFRGRNDSNIPIKLNSASVIPVIFASTLMSLPTTIVSVLGDKVPDNTRYWLTQIFSTTYTSNGDVTLTFIGFPLYIILIFLFSFFYSFLQMNPEKMSDNLQKQNAYVPGVRPGEETTAYISRVLFKITVVGATYLAIIAILPVLLTSIFNLPSSVSIGGTSLIIVVGVAVETAKQLKTTQQEKQYRGFME